MIFCTSDQRYIGATSDLYGGQVRPVIAQRAELCGAASQGIGQPSDAEMKIIATINGFIVIPPLRFPGPGLTTRTAG